MKTTKDGHSGNSSAAYAINRLFCAGCEITLLATLLLNNMTSKSFNDEVLVDVSSTILVLQFTMSDNKCRSAAIRAVSAGNSKCTAILDKGKGSKV